MSESNPWTDQWLKAQQQFVGAWSDMAKATSGNTGNSANNQANMWADSFELWRKACSGSTQPDMQQALNKCMDMGKGYFAMAEQVGQNMAGGAAASDAIMQWVEQLKKGLQQFTSLTSPATNGAFNDVLKQWFTPGESWQQMAAAITPMNQTFWQLPGLNTSVFNMGEAIDPLGKILSSPGVGYFREPQEKQQQGIQLAMDYQQSNFMFNQAFARVSLESIQGFQERLLGLGQEGIPNSLRGLYDLWVEISEEHYAEFAMSEEYQALYGDMVNRLMILKKHYHDIADDFLVAMNLPSSSEVDTMQMRLQQVRRENIVLKKEVKEIKSMLEKITNANPSEAPVKTVTRKKAPSKKAAVKKAARVKAKTSPTKAKAGTRK